MNSMLRKTFSARPNEVPVQWLLVDLDGRTLGRVASEIARILRGKHKAQFTPHVDTGDFVVAINAEKIHLTGEKLTQKRYYRHSGHPGGLSSFSAGELLARKPGEVLRLAVRGMLPKNTLGRQLLRKLKIYAGATHPHAAQQPKAVEIH